MGAARYAAPSISFVVVVVSRAAPLFPAVAGRVRQAAQPIRSQLSVVRRVATVEWGGFEPVRRVAQSKLCEQDKLQVAHVRTSWSGDDEIVELCEKPVRVVAIQER